MKLSQDMQKNVPSPKAHAEKSSGFEIKVLLLALLLVFVNGMLREHGLLEVRCQVGPQPHPVSAWRACGAHARGAGRVFFGKSSCPGEETLLEWLARRFAFVCLFFHVDINFILVIRYKTRVKNSCALQIFTNQASSLPLLMDSLSLCRRTGANCK